MKIKIRSFARFREIFGEERTIEITNDASPITVLTALCEEAEGCRDALFAADGTLHPHITVIHNTKRLSARETEESSLTDGDELVVYPPVSGG